MRDSMDKRVSYMKQRWANPKERSKIIKGMCNRKRMKELEVGIVQRRVCLTCGTVLKQWK